LYRLKITLTKNRTARTTQWIESKLILALLQIKEKFSNFNPQIWLNQVLLDPQLLKTLNPSIELTVWRIIKNLQSEKWATIKPSLNFLKENLYREKQVTYMIILRDTEILANNQKSYSVYRMIIVFQIIWKMRRMKILVYCSTTLTTLRL